MVRRSGRANLLTAWQRAWMIMSSLPAEAGVPPARVEPISRAGLRVSEAVYWRDYYLESDIHYEWNDGRLEEKPVSDYETYLVYAWFTDLLRRFLSVHPIASMVALEMGFRLPLPHKTVIRKPDLGVVTKTNPQPLLPLDCSYHGIFDLCIEALSDRERGGIERDTVTKKQEYARAGVREYYLLHRDEGRLAFFTRDDRGIYVPMDRVDGVVHSLVLPGFRFRIQDLLQQPTLDGLRDDPLYWDFVLPGWQQAERTAREEAEARQQAEQRAEKEAEARHQAEQRAEREAAARRSAEHEAERLRALLARLDRES